MVYTVGIQVPVDLQNRISQFCVQNGCPYEENSITLLPSILLANVTGLRQRLQTFCLGQDSFRVILSSPYAFSGQLLLLSVLPGQINIVREKLLGFLKIEDPVAAYHPYLPVARNQPDCPQVGIQGLLEEAHKTFREPYSFDAGQLVLYGQQEDMDRALPVATIPFTGRS